MKYAKHTDRTIVANDTAANIAGEIFLKYKMIAPKNRIIAVKMSQIFSELAARRIVSPVRWITQLMYFSGRLITKAATLCA